MRRRGCADLRWPEVDGSSERQHVPHDAAMLERLFKLRDKLVSWVEEFAYVDSVGREDLAQRFRQRQ